MEKKRQVIKTTKVDKVGMSKLGVPQANKKHTRGVQVFRLKFKFLFVEMKETLHIGIFYKCNQI